MNTNNKSQAEIDQLKTRKKRKLNEISKSENLLVEEIVPVVKTDIKECPFNPFGNDECDMCGS